MTGDIQDERYAGEGERHYRDPFRHSGDRHEEHSHDRVRQCEERQCRVGAIQHEPPRVEICRPRDGAALRERQGAFFAAIEDKALIRIVVAIPPCKIEDYRGYTLVLAVRG